MTFVGVILIVKNGIRFGNHLSDIFWCYINSEIGN